MAVKVARALASLALQLKAEVEESANQKLIRQCLIDAAAAAAGGCDSSAARMATQFAAESLGSGSMQAWFGDTTGLNALGAAFVNSSAMSALDVDDGNRSARGHLGAAVIPAAVAYGARAGVSSATFAHAVLAGCEIGARLGAAEAPPFSASGRWAGVGAAISTGICLSLNEAMLENAISLAVHSAPMLGPAGSRIQMTGHIKEGVPFGLLSGVTSALLAAQGYRGDPDAIESTGIYDVHQLELSPRGTLAFGRTYFKQYTCCRLAHAPIDAAVTIVQREGLAMEDVDQITIRTFRTAIDLPNEARPSSFESAQFSLPFAVAAALVRGKEALLPLESAMLDDPRVIGLAERIALEHAPELDPLYPSATPTCVLIRTRGGQSYREQRDTADGDPSRSFTDAQLLGKLEVLAHGKVARERVIAIGLLLRQKVPSPSAYANALEGGASHGDALSPVLAR
ncbi:2-methylcitrate dehydratase PrpD [Variovorax sp. YR634]|uniref:MmgE/PrpD family protein n=1 Tax=Variovorax sp. YR634 TaxID=1884385 RepID=UPI0008953DB8|nr:MmgE/PrpD family protein [Variovorax sp. YR634]SDZ44651.1 2-methylcitrate dehydratase PrpD [Variovorax sp. YR634]